MNAHIKALTILLLTFAFQISIFSQTIKSTTVDAKTGNPIPYVNIGIIRQNLGTISNNKGLFELTLPQVQLEEGMHFSSIGYADTTIQISQLLKHPKTPILLRPINYTIKQVTVSPMGRKIKTLGVEPFKHQVSSEYSFSLDSGAIGAEVALYIPNNKKLDLASFYFQPAGSKAQKTLFRLIVYECTTFPDTVDYERRIKEAKREGETFVQFQANDSSKQVIQPSRINEQDILIAWDKVMLDSLIRKGKPYEIDIQQYGLSTDKDLIVSLQMLECSDRKISICGRGKDSCTALLRQYSWQRWSTFPSIPIMGIKAYESKKE